MFSAKAVVHGDHPRWDKNIDVVNIPGNVGPFWFELSRDAANLSIYCFDVGLVTIKGCCDLETEVEFSEPVFLQQHKGQMRRPSFQDMFRSATLARGHGSGGSTSNAIGRHMKDKWETSEGNHAPDKWETSEGNHATNQTQSGRQVGDT